MSESLTYADAGVDIEKANKLVDTIKQIAKQTSIDGVMGDIGGFGGLFSLESSGVEHPVLVSSTDGVGTKLKIAFLTGEHDTVGIDLVAMCVNDIAVQGARPLFFLDYLSMGKLDPQVATDIISGVGRGCREAGCALIGGETAEMPGMYPPGEYDLAGFAVGIVDRRRIIDGSRVKPGHQLIGIASSGLHSNGYSLVRKICLEKLNLSLDTRIQQLDGQPLGEALLTPTRIYAKTILALAETQPVDAIAHITGGGISENILRVIPDTCGVVIEKGSWEIPPIFKFLQKAANISHPEMMRTFNNGIGLVIAVPETAADPVCQQLLELEENAYRIGRVTRVADGQKRFVWA